MKTDVSNIHKEMREEIENFRKDLNSKPNLNKIGLMCIAPTDHFYVRAIQRGLTLDTIKEDINSIFIHNVGVILNKLKISREFSINLGKYSYKCSALEPKRLIGYPNDVYVTGIKFITVIGEVKKYKRK